MQAPKGGRRDSSDVRGNWVSERDCQQLAWTPRERLTESSCNSNKGKAHSRKGIMLHRGFEKTKYTSSRSMHVYRYTCRKWRLNNKKNTIQKNGYTQKKVMKQKPKKKKYTKHTYTFLALLYKRGVQKIRINNSPYQPQLSLQQPFLMTG